MELCDSTNHDEVVKYSYELKSSSNAYPETLRKYRHNEFFPHYSNSILYKHREFKGKIPKTNNVSE